MPFDGSGNYVPPGPPTFPAVSGTTITSSYFNATINDIATALSNCLTRDNQGKPSVNMNWNGYNLTNVGNFSYNNVATIPDGTLAAPSLKFGAGSGGIFKNASGYIGFSQSLSVESATDTNGFVQFKNTVADWSAGMLGTSPWSRWSLYNNLTTTEVISVIQSGLVGIGQTAPVAKLQVQRSNAAEAFRAEGGSGAYSGNVVLLGVSGITNGYTLSKDASNNITHIWAGTAGAEFMRIQPDGKVGIGIPAPAECLDVGGVVQALSPNVLTKGAFIIRDAAGNPGACIIQAVSNNGLTQYGYIKLDTGTTSFSGNIAPTVDGVVGCGLPSNRWNTVYAVTGTINTSDATAKRVLGPIDDNLLDAIGDVEIVIYQFLDAVAEKGEAGARHHAGITAQALQTALASRGIDAEKCAVFCSDTLEDGSIRHGVRYTELLVLMMAWTRRELSGIKSRLTALENV